MCVLWLVRRGAVEVRAALVTFCGGARVVWRVVHVMQGDCPTNCVRPGLLIDRSQSGIRSPK